LAKIQKEIHSARVAFGRKENAGGAVHKKTLRKRTKFLKIAERHPEVGEKRTCEGRWTFGSTPVGGVNAKV